MALLSYTESVTTGDDVAIITPNRGTSNVPTYAYITPDSNIIVGGPASVDYPVAANTTLRLRLVAGDVVYARGDGGAADIEILLTGI